MGKQQKTFSLSPFCIPLKNNLKIYYLFCFMTDGMIISHLPFGPTAYFSLSNTVLRHDIPDVGKMSEVFPHLIFHNFKTKLGQRVMS